MSYNVLGCFFWKLFFSMVIRFICFEKLNANLNKVLVGGKAKRSECFSWNSKSWLKSSVYKC